MERLKTCILFMILGIETYFTPYNQLEHPREHLEQPYKDQDHLSNHLGHPNNHPDRTKDTGTP